MKRVNSKGRIWLGGHVLDPTKSYSAATHHYLDEKWILIRSLCYKMRYFSIKELLHIHTGTRQTQIQIPKQFCVIQWMPRSSYSWNLPNKPIRYDERHRCPHSLCKLQVHPLNSVLEQRSLTSISFPYYTSTEELPPLYSLPALHRTPLHSPLFHFTTPNLLHYTTLHSSHRHRTTLACTLLHYTLVHSNLLHSTAQPKPTPASHI